MRVAARICYPDQPEEFWVEELDFPYLDYKSEADRERAKEAVRVTLKNFNKSKGVRQRKLLATKALGPSLGHNWEKSNLITLKGKGGMYDTGRCANCGATGKRYGLGGTFLPDRKNQTECPNGK